MDPSALVGSEYLRRSVNHQWTKSAEYEQALQQYAARWLPGAPSYCSPLRPLYELQTIRSLEPHMDEHFQTQSCNKLKGRGWCLRCAKCAWVFLATTALFGRETAIAKAGGGGDLRALEACLRDPAILGTRTLKAVLKDWGQDDLMPVGLRERVRQA
jgi:hypothetical protein